MLNERDLHIRSITGVEENCTGSLNDLGLEALPEIARLFEPFDAGDGEADQTIRVTLEFQDGTVCEWTEPGAPLDLMGCLRAMALYTANNPTHGYNSAGKDQFVSRAKQYLRQNKHLVDELIYLTAQVRNDLYYIMNEGQ